MHALARTGAVIGIELRLAVRNRWVLLATATLTLFALALAFVGSSPSGALKTDALTLTAVSLATLSVYLVPLIALLLTYDAVAGEIERGTLALVLATPIGRAELLVGKFLGAFGVLAIAIIVGYGLAGGAVVAINGLTPAGLLNWARLMSTAILLGAVFLALGIALSSASLRAGTAAALAIGTWLVLVVLYDLALLGAIIIDGGGVFTKTVFPLLVLANPGDAFRLFNLATVDAGVPVAGLDGLATTLPFPPATALIALAAWLGVMSFASIVLVRRVRP
jgi:Cu-processing system permease protein